ncbi:MAG: sugar ABC transporter substrate-binding protein [Bacteroidetes bacterium]|nr:sugar ABC transporter substrate-binding protein [Bacteroidota bacterium]
MRMKLYGKIFSYFCFLISVFLIVGCSKREDKTITLNFWAMGVEGETVSKLVPEFEKQNPNIKIKVLQIAWVAAHEKLIIAFASETLPDVFQLGNTWIPEFQSLNAIEPLNPFIDKSSIIHAGNYFPGIWETNLIDTTVYGIPWYVDTRVLFYRKDILEKVGYRNPPRTWAELYDVSKKIKQKFNRFSFFIPTNEWLPFILFGIQNGSTLLKDNNSYGDFSGKKFSDAIKFLAKFYHEGLAPIDMQQVMNVYQAFGEGFFSLYITGPWNVTEFQKRLPADVQNEWMTAPLPSPNNDYPGYSLAGGSSLVLNNKSEHKAAAWKFIEFLSESKTQLQFYKLVSSLPAVKEVWNDSAFVYNPYMKAFYEQLQKTKPTPKIPEWEQIVFSKVQQNFAEKIARTKEPIDNVLKQLDGDVNSVLEKRRWLLEHNRH